MIFQEYKDNTYNSLMPPSLASKLRTRVEVVLSSLEDSSQIRLELIKRVQSGFYIPILDEIEKVSDAMKQEELLESLALGICEEAMGAVNKHKVKKGDRDEMKRLSLQQKRVVLQGCNLPQSPGLSWSTYCIDL